MIKSVSLYYVTMISFSISITVVVVEVVLVEVLLVVLCVVVVVVVVLVEVVELSVIHVGSSLGVTGDSVEGNQSSGIVNGGKVGQFGSTIMSNV